MLDSAPGIDWAPAPHPPLLAQPERRQRRVFKRRKPALLQRQRGPGQPPKDGSSQAGGDDPEPAPLGQPGNVPSSEAAFPPTLCVGVCVWGGGFGGGRAKAAPRSWAVVLAESPCSAHRGRGRRALPPDPVASSRRPAVTGRRGSGENGEGGRSRAENQIDAAGQAAARGRKGRRMRAPPTTLPSALSAPKRWAGAAGLGPLLLRGSYGSAEGISAE